MRNEQTLSDIMNRPCLLIFGHGYTANAFVDYLKNTNWEIFGTTRSSQNANLLIKKGVKPLTWSDDPKIRSVIDRSDYILHSIPPTELGDPVFKRFSEAITSRSTNLSWFGYLSTTSVYGNHDGRWVDENIPVNPSSNRGLLRVEAENNWSNIKPVNYSGGWVTPYKIHPNNPDLIVAGYDEVYRSLTAAADWDSVSYNVSGGQSIKTIALAPSNQNYIYAATYSTLKVTTDAGLSWTSIKAGLPNYNITDVVVSSVNPDHLWVTFSEYSANHKVYESTDRGTTWNNITGNNLPNLPVNCIVYQGMSNEEL